MWKKWLFVCQKFSNFQVACKSLITGHLCLPLILILLRDTWKHFCTSKLTLTCLSSPANFHGSHVRFYFGFIFLLVSLLTAGHFYVIGFIDWLIDKMPQAWNLKYTHREKVNLNENKKKNWRIFRHKTILKRKKPYHKNTRSLLQWHKKAFSVLFKDIVGHKKCITLWLTL